MLESELFAFLDNTADAVFAVRQSGEICFWNRAAENLIGYSAEEAIGKGCSTILNGIGSLGTEVCLEHCVALEGARKSVRIPNFDLNVATRNGDRLWINISSIAYSNKRTQKTLLVHLVRDISIQKKREEVFKRMVDVSKEVAALDSKATGAAPVALLSSQELEILKMFAAGRTAPRVAKALSISPQTLRNHLHHINQKLRTHNRLEAVMHALQCRLI